MSPAALTVRERPGSHALVNVGLLSARSQPRDDRRGYLADTGKSCSSPEPGLLATQHPGNLGAVNRAPPPLFSRSHVDDLRHQSAAPVVNLIRRGLRFDTGMGHAESYSRRGGGFFDRGDGQNDRR